MVSDREVESDDSGEDESCTDDFDDKDTNILHNGLPSVSQRDVGELKMWVDKIIFLNKSKV